MFYWLKPLPDCEIDHNKYKPVIENDWFRKNFMYFVYALQGTLIAWSIILGVWDFSNIITKTLVFILVYGIHELLHISVVWKIGDISMTHSGIFFWLNSSAKMSKGRFFTFMSLPLWGLTVIPLVVAICTDGTIFLYARYIAWINAIIAGSDIINTFVIMSKPRNSVFYRGFFNVEDQSFYKQ